MSFLELELIYMFSQDVLIWSLYPADNIHSAFLLVMFL